MQASQAGQTATLEPSSPTWLTLWKDGSAATASTLTALSLVAAAIVSVLLYRNRFPRAKVTHSLHDWPADGKRIVRGVVRVENVGNVMIQLGSIQGVLTQILPLPSDVSEALARGGTALDKNATEIVWETLCDRSKDFSEEGCEVEPGEVDEFLFDFVIPADVTKIQFYSHIKNVKKWKRNIGWNTSTIYDIHHGKTDKHVIPEGAGSSETGKVSTPSTAEEGVSSHD